MKSLALGAELFHADRQTNMTKLIVEYHTLCQQVKNMFGEAMLHLPKILTLGLLLRNHKALGLNLIPKESLFEPKVFLVYFSH